jgi:hypothetical protein
MTMIDDAQKRAKARQNPWGYQRQAQKPTQLYSSTSAYDQEAPRIRPLTQPAGLTDKERADRDKADVEMKKQWDTADQAAMTADKAEEDAAFQQGIASGVWAKMRNTLGGGN